MKLEEELIGLLSSKVLPFDTVSKELDFSLHKYSRRMFEQALTNIRKYGGYKVVTHYHGTSPAEYEILITDAQR